MRRLGAEDGQHVGEVLVEAFADDPFFGWIWSTDPRGAGAGLTEWMALVLERLAGRAYVGVDEDSAAIWIHPDRPLEGGDYAAIADLLHRQVGARATDVMAAIGSTGPLVPDARHLTLLYVGVRPAGQGKGAGTRIVADGLRTAAHEGIGVHLNSTNARNVPFYERLGFHVLGETGSHGSPILRPMWRPPAGE